MITRKMLMLGTDVCYAGLCLLPIGFILQSLDNFFYVVPGHRLLYLGVAFGLTVVLSQAFRIMARHAEQGRGGGRMDYAPLMIPVAAGSRRLDRRAGRRA